MTTLVILEGLVIALLVVLVAGLLRSHADILRRLHALDGGETGGGQVGGLQVVNRQTRALPEAVAGASLSGGSMTVPLHQSRGLALLAFLSSGCSTCRPFWEAFSGNAPMPGADVRPLIVTKDATEESPSELAKLAPRDISLVMSSQAWDDFRIPGSPYFVLVDTGAGQVVGEGAAASWQHVHDLLQQAMADAGHGPGGGLSTRDRAARTDQHLLSAGIEPGDPSLYRDPGGDQP